MFPNPVKDPKRFGMTALLGAVLFIAVGAILGAVKLLVPSLATPIERQGTGIGAVDAKLRQAGSSLRLVG